MSLASMKKACGGAKKNRQRFLLASRARNQTSFSRSMYLDATRVSSHPLVLISPPLILALSVQPPDFSHSHLMALIQSSQLTSSNLSSQFITQISAIFSSHFYVSHLISEIVTEKFRLPRSPAIAHLLHVDAGLGTGFQELNPIVDGELCDEELKKQPLLIEQDGGK